MTDSADQPRYVLTQTGLIAILEVACQTDQVFEGLREMVEAGRLWIPHQEWKLVKSQRVLDEFSNCKDKFVLPAVDPRIVPCLNEVNRRLGGEAFGLSNAGDQGNAWVLAAAFALQAVVVVERGRTATLPGFCDKAEHQHCNLAEMLHDEGICN